MGVAHTLLDCACFKAFDDCLFFEPVFVNYVVIFESGLIVSTERVFTTTEEETN